MSAFPPTWQDVMQAVQKMTGASARDLRALSRSSRRTSARMVYVAAMRDLGHPLRGIAASMGVCSSTVHRLCAGARRSESVMVEARLVVDEARRVQLNRRSR